jgi:hypothetical protein
MLAKFLLDQDSQAHPVRVAQPDCRRLMVCLLGFPGDIIIRVLDVAAPSQHRHPPARGTAERRSDSKGLSGPPPSSITTGYGFWPRGTGIRTQIMTLLGGEPVYVYRVSMAVHISGKGLNLPLTRSTDPNW